MSSSYRVGFVFTDSKVNYLNLFILTMIFVNDNIFIFDITVVNTSLIIYNSKKKLNY